MKKSHNVSSLELTDEHIILALSLKYTHTHVFSSQSHEFKILYDYKISYINIKIDSLFSINTHMQS